MIITKSPTGIKNGLIIKGSEDEKKIVRKFSEKFLVTFSKVARFKNSEYAFSFLKPGDIYNEMFNLQNEVLLLFSSYSDFDTRTFDYVDKLLFEYDNRLDKICIILVSNDENIHRKIEKHNNDNKESKIVVAFTYDEILSKGFSTIHIENKLRKSFYNRDLFALESPLKSENYFYGRTNVVQSFYDKYSLGEHSGLFGLRKIGKTSVLYALERIITLKNGNSIYIDCQDTSIHKSRWNQLLFKIAKNVKEKYQVEVELNSLESYTENGASECFEEDLKKLKKALNNNRILLIFDEIEHISFKTSSSDHWKDGADYISFWQTLRAINQKNEDLFCFIIAGVNPLCIEQANINEYDNPIFSLIKPTYLNLFDVKNVKEMITNIGNYMGLTFDEKIFTYLHDDFGGHPFLIRHVCSHINTEIKTDRPIKFTEYQYQDKKNEYNQKIQTYVDLIIYVLEKWYPEEYHLLEILIGQGNEKFKNEISRNPNIVEHLKGYGILKEENNNFYITISALSHYIKSKVDSMARLDSKQGRQLEISAKRNELEDKLRKLILMTLHTNLGTKEKAKQMVLSAIEEKRRDALKSLPLQEIFNEKLFFIDLKQIINKNWSMFEKLFQDKSKFDGYIDFINRFRIDAHCKDISEEDLGILLIAFKWFKEKLDDLPF